MRREREELGLEHLVAEEHDEVREPRAADLRERLVVEVVREVDTGDLRRAERPSRIAFTSMVS